MVMPTLTFQIRRYEIMLSDRRSWLGKTYPGVIRCKGSDGQSFVLYFYYDCDPNIADTTILLNKHGTIHLNLRDMGLYVDLLRNEKPVYAYVNSDHPEWNAIFTGEEHVGEEET